MVQLWPNGAMPLSLQNGRDTLLKLLSSHNESPARRAQPLPRKQEFSSHRNVCAPKDATTPPPMECDWPYKLGVSNSDLWDCFNDVA